jgi:hypothetical protein
MEEPASDDIGHQAPAFVTIPVGARKLGVGARLLRRAVAAGELDLYDLGQRPRVAWRELIAWARRQRRANDVGSRP